MDRVNLVLSFTQDIAQCLDHDKYPTSFLFWVRGKVKDNSKDNDSTTEKGETRRGEFWAGNYLSVDSLPGSGLSIGFQR